MALSWPEDTALPQFSLTSDSYSLSTLSFTGFLSRGGGRSLIQVFHLSLSTPEVLILSSLTSCKPLYKLLFPAKKEDSLVRAKGCINPWI